MRPLSFIQAGALQGLTQQANTPMAGQAQVPDLLGAAGQGYQGALNKYGTQQAAKNSTLGGLGGLAGMGAGALFGGPAGAMIGGQVGSKL